MAYNQKKIYEQAEEDAIPTMGIKESLQYFDKKNQFKNEKELIENVLPHLGDLIKRIYGYDVESIELEKSFNLRLHDLPNQRVDIFCTTKQGVDLFIECKNPTNNYGELNLCLGQMMNYQMIIEALVNPTKLILITSRFHFYLARTAKRFNLNYDVILHNKKTTMFLLNSEL